MVSGHSFLPNDRDFAHVEVAARKTEHIFIPEDWERVVAQAKRKNAFAVRRMARKDFVSLKPLIEVIVNRKKRHKPWACSVVEDALAACYQGQASAVQLPVHDERTGELEDS